ncbi:MAG: nucleotide exchange factor GrpE [Bdellovibrionota bacterium]
MFYKSSPSFASQESSSCEASSKTEPENQEELKSPEQIRIETLEAEVASLNTKYTETHERMMRIAADADNTRKRLEKEKIESRMYAIQDFAKDLLPVIDAFDKAMASIEESQINFESEEGKKFSAIIEGVQLVTKVFQDATKKHGIERLPGKGAPFNPMFHNAIAKVSDGSLTQETVVDEFMAGYKIGDRILRTAMVRVSSPD